MRESIMLPLKKSYIANQNKFQLLTYSQPESIIADQFRAIRTNLKFLTHQNKQNIILFTSSGRGEGKSTLIGNLAVSIAQQDEKVLLIDANLRDSTQHLLFNVPKEKGLTDVLSGSSTLFEAIKHSNTKHLDILTSGSEASNPTELLGNENMISLLQLVATDYDVVMIDSATVLDSTDTSIIANQCTGVILVVNKGKTKIESVIEAKRVLSLAHAKLLGVIFNKN